MPKLTKEAHLFNFWQELVSHTSSLTSIGKDVLVSLKVDSEVYENIDVKDIKKNEKEIYINLSSKIKITLFSKKEYEYYFNNLFDESRSNTFEIAEGEFTKVFKFYKEIQFEDL